MEYQKRLNPERSLRTPKGIKGTKQKVLSLIIPVRLIKIS